VHLWLITALAVSAAIMAFIGLFALRGVTAEDDVAPAALPQSRANEIRPKSHTAELPTDGYVDVQGRLEEPGTNTSKRIEVFSTVIDDSVGDPEEAIESDELPAHLQVLRQGMEDIHERYELAKAHGLPEEISYAHFLQQCSIVAVLDLAGDYVPVQDEGEAASIAGEAETVVFWHGRSYTIHKSQFPAFYELMAYVSEPTQDIGTERRTALLLHVETQYAEAMGLLRHDGK
jgi:hypothetical protein